MRIDWKSQNNPLDAGLLILAASILGGLAVLVFGQASGKLQHDRRHGEAPPASGQVPAERHQNIQGSASR